MSEVELSFGALLRERRLKSHISLREFAKRIGISPTYLSQIETSQLSPPATQHIRMIANIFGEVEEQWIALAGRIPDDLPRIIQERPLQMAAMIRAASKVSTARLQELTEAAIAIGLFEQDSPTPNQGQ